RENFPMRMMGLVIGASGMAGSLGMALGPLLGGWIYDAYATYFWLYLISFALGIGAALIAATFRPFAEPARALGQAEEYRNAWPGWMVGCSPTTPGPSTVSRWQSASVMRQWRCISLTGFGPWLAISMV